MSGLAAVPGLAEAHARIERLTTLVEASKLINSSLETDRLYQSILTVAQKELEVERGTLYFVDERAGQIWAKFASGLGAREIRIPIGQGLAGTVAATGETIIIHDAYADPRFDRSVDRRSGFLTRSMLCVPIRSRTGKIVGVLQLLNKRHGEFGPADTGFLEALSDHMAIAMENATLHESLIEKNRMERELQLGREIQSRLLPPPFLDVPGTELAATNRPCYEVGGDAYDFIRLPGGELGLAIADVSGKGVAAALIMSSLQASLRMGAATEPDLPRLVTHLNQLIYDMTKARKYVTLFFSRYDPVRGVLRYVNAGHNPPILGAPDGTTTLLSATGVPVGLMSAATYEERFVVVPPGGTLLLYTDGVTEATNAEEEEFGMTRLSETFAGIRGAAAAAVTGSVLDAVTAFENGIEPADDTTLVVLRRTGATGASATLTAPNVP